MSNGTSTQPAKPNWMSAAVFADLRQMFEVGYGRFHCAGCSCDIGPETEQGLTWDHIVPRSRGGEDVVDNLQPMCLPCNSRKSNCPDGYWDQRFYFDGDDVIANADGLAFTSREHQHAIPLSVS